MTTNTGARVRQLRQARELTTQVLATRAGISTRWLQMIEHGQGQLRPRIARALAGVLDVDPAAFFTGEAPTLLTDEGSARGES